MRNAFTYIIELLLGIILIGLGLMYLTDQNNSLSRLTDVISQNIIQDSKVYQQYNHTLEPTLDNEVYDGLSW